MSKARSRAKKLNVGSERADRESGVPSARTESSPASKMAALVKELLLEEEGAPANKFSGRQPQRKATHNPEGVNVRAEGILDRIEREIEKDGSELEQQRADNDDRARRRESDEAARGREEDRKDIRLMVEVEEKRHAMRQRDVILAVTALCAIATIVLAFITAAHREPWSLGISVATGCLSGGGFYLLRSLPWAGRQEEELEGEGGRA